MNKLLSIPFVIFCVINLHAQDSVPTIYPPNERFGVKEGLSQGLVMSMMQDKEGYMWFGTSDGLNKYDGYNITIYRNNPDDKYSLPENVVSGLAEDKYGNFWVAIYHKGLYLFDRKTERFYPTPVKSEFINFLKIYDDKLAISGDISVSIYHIKPTNLLKDSAHVNQDMQLLFSYNALQQKFAIKPTTQRIIKTWMPDGSFWAVVNDTVLHYIPSSFQNWQLKTYNVHTLGMDVSSALDAAMAPISHVPGQLLIYTNGKLSEFDEQQKKIIYSIAFPSIIKHPGKLIKQFNDSIYLLSDDENLLAFNQHTKKICKWDMQHQMSNMCFNYCQPLTDVNGIGWLGSNGWGVLKCDLLKQHFTNYKIIDNVYFTKLNSSYDPLPWKISELYSFDYDQLTQDKQGIYWMYVFIKATSNAKLISFDPKTNSTHTWPGLKDNTVLYASVYNDQQNRLWISTTDLSHRNKIYQIDKQTGKPLEEWQIPDDGIKWDYNYIMQWWQDAHQVFWLATVDGLYSFDFIRNKWKRWLHKEEDTSSISTNWLYTVCADPVESQHYLWLGTNGNGFDKFDMLTHKCIKHYSMADGLPNNVVYGIMPDKAGNLWMSTNKGLSCFNPGVKEFSNFSQEDGLPGDEFNHLQFLKLKNGDLLFGGVEGATVFNPAMVLQQQKPAPIVFTGLSISNKPVNWKQDSTVLSSPINYAKTITLHPGQNMFTISFASLEYRSNKKKFYKYKLDGFDKNYTEPSNKNEATYTNLSPGSYTLYMNGTNSDGVWNDKGTSIQIIVLPYWYQTYWFMALIALLVIVIFYLFYRYRLRQVLKMERLRNRIANDLHDEIGSTLSSISLYGESAKMMMKDNEAAGSVLSKINTSTSEMMEAMSDIVWAINTRNDNLDNLANRMRSFAVQMTESKNIQLHFTENENLPSMPLNMEQRKNIYLIFKEATNNAIKYSSCQNLWVSFVSEQHVLKMMIKDDGKGYATQSSLHNNRMNGSLGGNGIASMKKRAKQIKAELFINSKIDEGTAIILNVQLKKS